MSLPSLSGGATLAHKPPQRQSIRLVFFFFQLNAVVLTDYSRFSLIILVLLTIGYVHFLLFGVILRFCYLSVGYCLLYFYTAKK